MPLNSVHSDGTNKHSQQKIGTSASGSIDNTEKSVNHQPCCISRAKYFIRKMLFQPVLFKSASNSVVAFLYLSIACYLLCRKCLILTYPLYRLMLIYQSLSKFQGSLLIFACFSHQHWDEAVCVGRFQWAESIKRCQLTSIGNPFVIRRCNDCLISTMVFLIMVKRNIYIELGPWASSGIPARCQLCISIPVNYWYKARFHNPNWKFRSPIHGDSGLWCIFCCTLLTKTKFIEHWFIAKMEWCIIQIGNHFSPWALYSAIVKIGLLSEEIFVSNLL